MKTKTHFQSKRVARLPALFALATLVSIPITLNAQSADWPQWQGQNRDGMWSEQGIVESFPEEGLMKLWSSEVALGYAGPAVVGDKVYVADYVKSDGDDTPNAGKKSELSGQERVTCLDMNDGSVVWQHAYDCDYKLSYPGGPRVTPTVNDGHVYTLGAEGMLICFNADSGDVVWQRDLKKDYKLELAPHWGFAAHPLVDGDTLYCVVGGEGSVAVAYDKKTGIEKWRALSSETQGYCPPTMIEAGGTKQLLIWHPESLNSLNPETGEVYWSFAMKPAYGMSIIAPIQHGDYLYATALRGTSILLRLDKESPKAEEVWRDKGVHPDHNPPLIVDGHIYGVDEKGHLRCINLETGERVWESLAVATNGRPANSTTGFIVKNNDQYFVVTEQGELVLAKMDSEGFNEVSRFKLVEPTNRTGNRDVVWSHPAFANKCVFMRNDKEIVCYSLAK